MEWFRRRSTSGSDSSPRSPEPGTSSSERSEDTMLSYDQEPPEIDMTRSFLRDDVYTKLCDVIPPTIIGRDSSAIVNFDSAGSLSRQPSLGFRRMTSSRLSDGISPSVSGLSDSAVSRGEQQLEPSSSNSRVLSPMLASPSLQSNQNPTIQVEKRSVMEDSPFGALQSPERRMTGPSRRILWSNSRRDLEVAIQSQKSEDHRTWDEDLLTEEARLDQRLSKLNLEMFVMAGDGNCQFRAVSFELYGSQDYHRAVRKNAIDYMRSHREEFEPFLDEQFDRYLREMSRNGTWGDELTLRAISDGYGVVVNVITSEQHNWFMRYYPTDKKLSNEIFVTYIAPVHYNAIKRRKRTATALFTRRHSLILDAMDKAHQEEARIASIPEATVQDAPATGQLIAVGGT